MEPFQPLPITNDVLHATNDLKKLEEAILKSTNLSYTCAEMLDNWNPSKQPAFRREVEEFMNSLVNIQNEVSHVDERYHIPYEVIKQIDNGNNPDSVTKAALDENRNRNDRTRSQTAVIEIMRETIDASMAIWDASEAQEDMYEITKGARHPDNDEILGSLSNLSLNSSDNNDASS